MALEIRLMGPFDARLDGEALPLRSRRARALLGLLALSPSRCVTRDGAAEMLWPDRGEAQARASLRQELSVLKKALEPLGVDVFEADADRIELVDDAPVTFDVWAEDLAHGALRGALLEDVDLRSDIFEDWRRHQNAAILARQAARTEAALADAEARQDWEDAVRLADRLLQHDPLNEAAVAGKMRVALARGRRPEALALYRDHEARLARDLDASPGAALARIVSEAEGRPADAGAIEQPGVGRTIFARPAVLLLCFEHLGNDDDGQMIAEGIADDLRVTLSYWRWFPVIGPEAIGWKTAREIDLRGSAAEVGAGYVVSGSVRRMGDRIRISASLTAADSGRVLWSEAFDGMMDDIFAFQDEVSRAIVARLEPRLGQAEAERISRGRPGDLRAWQLVARADEIERRGGEGYGTRESNLEQKPLLEEATRLEPDYARAWSRIAKLYWRLFIMAWSDDHLGAMKASLEASGRAIAVDGQDWEAHAYHGLALIFGARDYGAGLFHAEESVRLNPSATLARHAYGCALEWVCRYEEAVEHFEAIFRLNPRHGARAAVLGDLTTCHMYLGELDRAVEEARQIVAIAPGYSRGLQRCLATFGAAGRSDLAEPVLELLLKAQPDFSENYVRETYPFSTDESLETFLRALRRGGWSGG